MICTSNYILIDPVNQNLTSVRRLEGPFLLNKGPFYEPEGTIMKYKTSYIDMGIKV